MRLLLLDRIKDIIAQNRQKRKGQTAFFCSVLFQQLKGRCFCAILRAIIKDKTKNNSERMLFMNCQVDQQELIALLRQCREIVMDKFAVRDVTEKGLADYVTAVDFHVQEFLGRELSQRWADIQLLSEEKSQEGLDFSKPCWILDPIDGTNNLIHDFKESAVSLALWDGEQLVFGAVYNPFTDELYHAAKGEGAYLNDTPIHVSSRPDLLHSLMIVGTSPYYKERAKEVFDLIRRVFERSEDIRRGGSAALEICKVACGRADGYLEKTLKPWDYAGGMMVLLEAGGTATNFEGVVPTAWQISDGVFTNGLIHQELLDTANEA
jgi:myo-inositol-1(or 4)-monophosphatase